MSFTSLGLSEPIVKAITEAGYDSPTAIQQQAIPEILAKKDVMAAAQTGTGKTAGFTLPLLQLLSQGPPAQNNQTRALILTPTRELASQVGDSVSRYANYLDLRTTVVYGGVKINPQMMKLRSGVDVLIATPGRLIDLYNQNAIKFSQLEVLVLDEADRMLDMGFIHDIRRIIKALPQQRQNLMFSATFSDDIRKLAKSIVNKPVEISVSPRNTTAETVKQWIIPADKKQKPALLSFLISHNDWQQVLVFVRTKHGANKLVRQLEGQGIKAAAIHGNKSQNARMKALAEFKQEKTSVLVATDIAARGLDIDQLPQVVNFDLPNVEEDYVHRIGRTGRAGSRGEAISLVCADEFKQLSDIERLIKRILPRKLIDGFEPAHNLPVSKLDLRPPRPKKPKKPKKKQSDEKPGTQTKHQKTGTKTKREDGNRNRKKENSTKEGRRNKTTGTASSKRQNEGRATRTYRKK